MRMVVDLPAPLGPRKPKISPRAMWKLTWSTATKSPNRLTRPSAIDLVELFAAARIGESDHVAFPGFGERHEHVLDAGRADCDLGERDAGAGERVAQLRDSPAGVVDHHMDAVADEEDVAHTGRARDRRAHRASSARGDGDQRTRHVLLERSGRIAIERMAGIEQGQPIAALRLVEIGGGDHDGDALLAQPVENAPEVAARHRIDAGGRLVEQQHLRRVDQRADEAELLLHAAGELCRP